MSDMPNEVWATPKGYADTGSSVNPDLVMIGEFYARDDGGQKYTRSDLTGLQCFYDYGGELPDKFIAIFSDGSGCGVFYNSHTNEFDERMYTSASDNDDIIGVDKDWFADAGYLWFIALPDDFKVWGRE